MAPGRPLESADTKANGTDYSSKDKWAATQELMSKYGGLYKAVDDFTFYCTNELLPQ